MALLVVMSGLPGTGKSTLAKSLAADMNMMWLRIDTIEQALKDSQRLKGDVEDAGYRVAYALAELNLKAGVSVVADAVNPWMLIRDAWRDVAHRCGVRVVEVETLCSDVQEHRHRIETRDTGIPNLARLDWDKVIQRDYHPWARDCFRVDTSHRPVDDCFADLKKYIQENGLV